MSKQNFILDIIDTYKTRWKVVINESRIYELEGDPFISFKIHPTIWCQKAKINYFNPYKSSKKVDSPFHTTNTHQRQHTHKEHVSYKQYIQYKV